MPLWVYWIITIAVLAGLAAAVYRMLKRAQTNRAYRNNDLPYEGSAHSERYE